MTGNLTTREQHPELPVTPEEIADAALAAAEEGAAVVHLHVRDPATGKPSMELEYYQDVVARIRGRNKDLIINLTTGPGGRFVVGEEDPKVAGPGTTLTTPEDPHGACHGAQAGYRDARPQHDEFGREVVINTPRNVRRMAAFLREAGAVPEIELFDSGDIALMRDMLADGSLAAPALTSFVMGVKYGFQPSPETVIYARNLLPADAQFTAIGIGRSAFPMVAQSVLAGGHARVGLEDATMIARGVLAPSNAAMVEKARRMVEDLGPRVVGPARARDIIGLS